MANEIFKSTIKLQQGLQVEVTSGKHKFMLDEPPQLGGTDTGMNPVEALLGSLGACMGIVAKSFAQMHKIDLQDLKIELEGDLDPDGFMGTNKEAKIGFSKIRINIDIKSNSSEEDIASFVRFVEKTSPVGDNIINATDMTTKFTIEKKIIYM